MPVVTETSPREAPEPSVGVYPPPDRSERSESRCLRAREPFRDPAAGRPALPLQVVMCLLPRVMEGS